MCDCADWKLDYFNRSHMDATNDAIAIFDKARLDALAEVGKGQLAEWPLNGPGWYDHLQAYCTLKNASDYLIKTCYRVRVRVEPVPEPCGICDQSQCQCMTGDRVGLKDFSVSS